MLRAVIGRPVSVAVATLTLVILGFFSLLRLPVSLLPTLERPRLVVTVRAAEASREELVRRVVRPLERRLQSLDGVLEVASTVDDGECVLTLDTEWQTDVDRLRIDAERRLAEVAGFAVDELAVRVEAGDGAPILRIAVLGGESAAARTVFAEKVLLPELGRLAGAGQLHRLGGASLRPVVRPNAAALAARGLTAEDLVRRLDSVGRTRPAGRLRDGGRVRPLVVREPVGSLAELAARRLGEAPGVALGEVAAVAMEEVPDASIFNLDGEPGVLVEVHRAPGANAVLLARAARRAVEELAGRAELGRGLRLEVVHDASLEVVAALAQLGLAALLGLLLGTVVLRFMLGSWRPTLALAVVVPASVVTAFGGFYLWEVSLDVVSLAGLALAAGMLVDNSIVVLEAIESARARRAEDGEQESAELAGTRQIALALAASFLTTAVVFLPLIYLQGLARAFFGVQAFAIVTSLAVSLVLSLSLTPVLARRLRRRRGRPARPRSPGRGLYLALLARALDRPWVVIAGAVLVLAGGVALLLSLPRELLPRGPSRMLSLEVELPEGLSREAAAARIEELERVVAEHAGTRQVSIFRRRDPLRPETLAAGEGGSLELAYADAASLVRARDGLARRLARLPGLEVELRQRRSAMASAVERSARRLEIELAAASEQRVERLAERVVAQLGRAAPGMRVRRVAGARGGAGGRPRPAFVLSWDTWRLAQLDADAVGLGTQVRAALGGFYAGRADIKGAEAEILVETSRPLDLRLVPVRPAGTAPADAAEDADPRVLPLAAVASLERRLRPPPLARRDGRPAVRLALDGTRLAPARLEETLATLPLAPDERVELGGQAHELRRSFAQLRLALGLALVLVFLTVAALYESLAMPWVVMTTVPVAVAGAGAALHATGGSLNVMSFLGLVLLTGIVVNNAIVLVHRIEQLRAAGRGARGAVSEAAAERYRPILMTTLTTLLGMVPLAALGGEGVELRGALAVAVSGGLVTSFFAALFVVPVLYRALVRRGEG